VSQGFHDIFSFMAMKEKEKESGGGGEVLRATNLKITFHAPLQKALGKGKP
jgi:hypothetical protein